MKTNKKIEDVMNSLEGIQRAEADPFLFPRISARLEQKKTEVPSGKLIWLMAASLVILLALNLTAIRVLNSKMNTTEYQANSNGYELVNTNSINYN